MTKTVEIVAFADEVPKTLNVWEELAEQMAAAGKRAAHLSRKGFAQGDAEGAEKAGLRLVTVTVRGLRQCWVEFIGELPPPPKRAVEVVASRVSEDPRVKSALGVAQPSVRTTQDGRNDSTVSSKAEVREFAATWKDCKGNTAAIGEALNISGRRFDHLRAEAKRDGLI